MKTIILLTISLLVGISASATSLQNGLRQLTFSFSTEGPDVYADGEPVQVGETYLLVYVNQGASFAGVRSDGELVDPVNNRIACRAKAVAGSRCGFTAVQYAPELYPQGGSWVVVLLDTRDASGVVGGLVAAQGATPAQDAASSSSVVLNAMHASSGTGGAPTVIASAASAAPADTPPPVIAGISQQADQVKIRIQNFTDRALYQVQSTDDLATGTWLPAVGGDRIQARPLDMQAGDLPVAVQVPKGDRVRFFRVIVPGGN